MHRKSLLCNPGKAEHSKVSRAWGEVSDVEKTHLVDQGSIQEGKKLNHSSSCFICYSSWVKNPATVAWILAHQQQDAWYFRHTTSSKDVPPKEGFLVWCHYLRQICFGNFLSGLLRADKWILCIGNICSEAARLISHFPEEEAVRGGFCSSRSHCPCKMTSLSQPRAWATCLRCQQPPTDARMTILVLSRQKGRTNDLPA